MMQSQWRSVAAPYGVLQRRLKSKEQLERVGNTRNETNHYFGFYQARDSRASDGGPLYEIPLNHLTRTTRNIVSLTALPEGGFAF